MCDADAMASTWGIEETIIQPDRESSGADGWRRLVGMTHDDADAFLIKVIENAIEPGLRS